MNEANAAIRLAAQNVMFGQWAAAEAAHGRAIGQRPDHSEAWMRRGELYATLGLWDFALRDYAHSFERRPPDQLWPWSQYALLHLQQGDEAGYRRVCQQMWKRFSPPKDKFTWNYLTSVRAMVPRSVPGCDPPAFPQEDTNIPPGVPWFINNVVGLAQFRAGLYPEAIRNFRESLAKTSYPGRAKNYPVLAMALYRSGEIGAARVELENSRKELDRWMQVALDSRDRLVLGSWFGGEHWADWVVFLIYHGEAWRLIEQTPPAEDPRLLVLRGRAFAALGRLDQADAEYAHAMALAPNNPQVQKAVETAKAAAQQSSSR